MTKIIILLALLIITGCSGKTDDNSNQIQPPKIEEKNNLLGFLDGKSSTLEELDENFICSNENIEQVPKSDNYTILYKNSSKPFADFISRINSDDGRFRFISFHNSNQTSGFKVAPFEFFENNYIFDIDSDGFCCIGLNKLDSIENNSIVLVYSDKDFEICKNPDNSSMSDIKVGINKTGWHLKFISKKEDLQLSNNLEVESVWSFPSSVDQKSILIWNNTEETAFEYENKVYWIHAIESSASNSSSSTSSVQNNQNLNSSEPGNSANDPNSNSGNSVDPSNASSNNSQANQNSNSTNNVGNTAVADLPDNFDITMQGMNFSVNEIRIKSGEEITLNFVNLDNAPHNFAIEGKSLRTDFLNKNETAVLTFEAFEPGTYTAICEAHPSMRVNIIVE